MYLKSIEVYGFKSFAQKIHFEFHNGITAIVGPNGSGKSNVADAVRWVLGEQSAKQLRGGNMQDVIFSGTESRKPLSYASVAITLDNSDHQLAIDFQEVTITRRLYRSGESEYLINGSTCRLKDINELFYDTGIGKEGYSIIGQGQIDKILSGKPEERRELFDEAAGIVKFKRRKNTTLKKLEEERQNLVRVTDILSELTRQLGPLEKQSETARIYLAKKETLKELDVNMFLLENAHLTSQLEEVGQKHALAEEHLEEVQEKYEETKAEHERLEQELELLNSKIEELREQGKQDALRKQQLEGQVGILKEQIRAGQLNDEHYKARLEAIAREVEKRKEELEHYEEEDSLYRFQLKETRRRLKEDEIHMEQVTGEIEACTQSVEEGKNEIIELLNSRANTKGNAQRYRAMKEQVAIRKASLSQRTLKLKSEEQEQKGILQNVQEEYKLLTSKIASMSQEEQRLEGEVEALSQELKRQNHQMEVGQSAYHREASRLESLKNITERYDGYGNSIRRVMEQKGKVPGIHGVVADLIQVQKDYELAIETALGGSIQNIVTDNEQTAKQMIEFLKRNKYGRATFLPLTAMSQRGEFQQKEALKEPGVIGIASDLVNADAKYQGVIRFLLGRILVVDHIDHAIAIGRKYRHSLRMVTIEGESLNAGGSMTGGAFKNNSNLLGRRREIEELEASVQALKADMESMQKQIDENRSKRNVLRDTIAEFREKMQSMYIQQNTLELNISTIHEKEEELKASYQSITREQQDIAQQMKELEVHESALQKELEASQKDEKELNTFIESRQKELDEQRVLEGELAKKLEEIRMEVSTLEQKNQFLKENVERIQKELAAYEEEKAGIQENLTAGSRDMEQKAAQIERLRQTMEDISQDEIRARENMEKYVEERETSNTSHKAFFQKRDDLSQQMNALDKECYRLRSQMDKLEETKEGLISYIWEEYEITPSQAGNYKKEEYTDRTQMKKRIAGIKEEIRNLGPVNVNAIEDYKEILERHTFLSGQYEDLIKAEATLMDIVTELDEGMRRQFTEKFSEIQIEFDKAFKELFGGGKGTLELDEEEDILEAGIRIISQPPGKKLQNMMQLSGGEKALTAIALLFAIQNLKPSPFCLLDEIEAALDDSNVNRFAGYLEKLTKNTQFIIITHRRGTMNAADRLYGITMQEKGVSTLVSVDLVENSLTK